MKNKKKILLIIYLNSQFVNILPLAKFILKTRQYEPIFLFSESFVSVASGADEAAKICFKEKIKVINHLGAVYQPARSQNQQTKIIGQVVYQTYSILSSIPLLNLISGPLMGYYFIREKQKIIKNIYQNIKPNLIILPEENAAELQTLYTVTAKKYAIASMIMPHTIANKRELAEINYQINYVRDLPSLLISYLFPRWVYKYKKRKIMLTTYSPIVALELLKLVPSDPWLVNHGFSDKIAVESNFMYQYYLKNKIPKNKLILVGSLNDDSIWQIQKNILQIKKNFKLKYHLNDNPIILCAIPSLQINRKMEFENYEQIIDFWIKSLTKNKNYNVIFHIHPNTAPKTQELLDGKGFKIVSGNIAELIPLCDLYVASVSATIRWAIACGIPVINYDVYRYGYHDYDNAGGVVTVEDKEDFIKIIKKITTSKKYYQQLQAKQRQCMNDWGMIDGKSGDRILNFFKELIG